MIKNLIRESETNGHENDEKIRDKPQTMMIKKIVVGCFSYPPAFLDFMRIIASNLLGIPRLLNL